MIFFQKRHAYTAKIANRAVTKPWGIMGAIENAENHVTVFRPLVVLRLDLIFSSTVKSAKAVPPHLASSNDMGSPNSDQSKSNLGSFTVHSSAKLGLETLESIVVCVGV